MELRRIMQQWEFPSPSDAEPSGLLAWGGDLRPERLLSAYAQGVFPWYESGPILWFSPDPRMVLQPSELRVSRSLRKTLSKRRYEVTIDRAFERVIRACAEIPRVDQDGTWITSDMIEAYSTLHALGFAHSVEAWDDDQLVGGAYGVSLGSAFFGESMFASRSDASKVAFVHLVRQLEAWDFDLVDCQVYTDHLASLGAEGWDRDDFLTALERALERPTRRGRWELEWTP